jgi:predicted RNA-binding protein with RPS1 domain
MEQATQTQAVKVRTLKGYCKAIYDVLKDGQPVQADVLDRACGNTKRGLPVSTDATSARIRDLRKPIYGGHNIVYDRKAQTYQLLLPQAA